jgi:hypothetical protein
MKQATITIACNILQNTAVVHINHVWQVYMFNSVIIFLAYYLSDNMCRHRSREVLLMASLLL